MQQGSTPVRTNVGQALRECSNLPVKPVFLCAGFPKAFFNLDMLLPLQRTPLFNQPASETFKKWQGVQHFEQS